VPGVARGFAYVRNGELDPNRSKGVTSFRSRDGRYCFGLDFDPVSVVVSAAEFAGNGPLTIVQGGVGTNPYWALCEESTSAWVATATGNSTGSIASGIDFYVLFN
jgi:hypothetical protein